ncbi:MAG: class I SAM-dependent methyltransferase [Reyranella sp.]|mgnify:CR=1 FL=1|uniref:class I SAM-dependent methyltransferase n=1 Tax=Reyranella sp. TaxID=1929291 RepID=UPI001AC75BAE|nr:class I SAM-dependent methyltransferase [Reyranella sp.]MBN9540858.1 class I SAM-dependent methyltransferase [Alphaproteobacteria bacterium]MBR2817065.1 class I SAM-dependent methyltransferase [Reyranella sp.]
MKSAADLAAEQSAFWKGAGGQGWLAAYRRIQRSLVDINKAVLALAAARPGERLIDVGCGTGDTTAALAAAVSPAGPLAGHVLGLDISEPLIEAARAQNLANAAFVVGDATVHPFEAGAADLVFSRFGVMFFGEPVAAFRNLHRALKPTGRLAFVCWRTPQENPWGLVPVRAAAPFLPPLQRPGPEEPGQYSFGDRNRVERILKESGFVGASLEPLDVSIHMGQDVAEIVANADRFGPLARPFAEATPEAADKARAAIAEALAPHAKPDGVSLPGACWLVTARVS